MKKKFVSVLLALTMSTTLSAGLTSTVFAEEAVSTASECSYDGGFSPTTFAAFLKSISSSIGITKT